MLVPAEGIRTEIRDQLKNNLSAPLLSEYASLFAPFKGPTIKFCSKIIIEQNLNLSRVLANYHPEFWGRNLLHTPLYAPLARSHGVPGPSASQANPGREPIIVPGSKPVEKVLGLMQVPNEQGWQRALCMWRRLVAKNVGWLMKF